MKKLHKPAVSIIVSTYYSKGLGILLDKLKEQTFKDFEVIVTDDGSKDFKYIKDYPFHLKYVWHQDTGRHWSAAHNEGMRLAQGEQVLFIHDDIIPEPNLIKRLVENSGPYTVTSGIRRTIPEEEAALKNPAAFTVDEDHRVQLHKDYFEVLNLDLTKPIDLQQYFRNPYQMVSGCILMMPAKILKQIGGCAEDYPGQGYEDYDLVLRLMRAGCSVYLDCQAIGYHFPEPAMPVEQAQTNMDEFSRRESQVGYINNFNYGL